MTIKINFAKTEDLKGIQNFNLLLFKKEYKDYDSTLNLKWTFNEGSKYFADRVKDDDFCLLVAKLDNKMVAYLSGRINKKLSTHRTLNNQAELESMLVLEEYRNRQIGTKLIEEFFTWAKNKGIKNIKVIASTENKEAIKFYKKHNFKNYNSILEVNL